MRCSLQRAAILTGSLLVSACASLPPERGYRETQEAVEARRGAAPPWSPAECDPAPEIPSEPIDAAAAVRFAFLHSPRVREEYARLGLSRADFEQARRIANPGFGFSHLDASGGGSNITRSVSFGLGDLLLLPARTRLAGGELERTQNEVAAALLQVATDVETTWYEAVGAAQVAAMRELVARSAGQSALLAQRYFEAGNIDRLQWEQERAAATQARLAALRADATARRARGELAQRMGLPSHAEWRLLERLPTPLPASSSGEQWLSLAMEQRLDLRAAQQAVALREDALGLARRWRWLGNFELGYERERESDGSRLNGPSLSFALPIFDQGQGALMRADAELQQARARLQALTLNVQHATRVGQERMDLARDISERYREELLPQREAIVARTQEQVNYMLVGVFELIQARQQEFDAYQEYLDAVRDYWVARAELRAAVGGRLPDDDAPVDASLGVDAILPAPSAPATEHSNHHRHHESGENP